MADRRVEMDISTAASKRNCRGDRPPPPAEPSELLAVAEERLHFATHGPTTSLPI
jgi:hypothetical protein